MQYIDYLLKAKQWLLFFDRHKAEEKAKEFRKKGFKTKIIRENGSQWTLFKL